MGSGQKPIQQMISNLGQNFNSTAQAMAKQPGITTAGLALGVPKGIADVPMYLGGGVGEAWNYLRGNTPQHGDSMLDKWEAGWRDAAINVGSLGQETDVDRLEKERAAGAALTITSMASPGLPLPGIGKALKGGAAGIAGENLVKGLSAATDYVAPVLGKVTSPILDPFLKGSGKAITSLEKGTSKILPGEAKEFLKVQLNAKSATNYIKSKDPHVLAILSDKYNVPIAKLDDLGEPLAAKYKQINNSLREEKELYELKKQVIKEQVKTSKIPGELKSQVRKQLTEGLQPPSSLESIDSFLAKELSEIKMSGESKHLLKEELKTHILYNQKYNDLAEANAVYNRMMDNAKALDKAIQKYKNVPEMQGYLDVIDKDKLVKSAQRLRTNYDNLYSKALLTNDDDIIKRAHEARVASNKKVMSELGELDINLVTKYDQTSTQSFVGQLGKFFNMFKVEPYIGDLTQVAEAFPQIKVGNAEALGIDYAQALKHEGEFGSWYGDKKKMVNDIIFSKYKNQLKALYESEGISFNSVKAGKDSSNNVFRVLGNAFDEFSYAAQSGARERLIENILLPSAYGQVKAWGRFTEGSMQFNNAVMNRTIKFMQDTGMIPTKMKSVAKISADKFKTVQHIDDLIKEVIQNSKLPETFKNELKSSALFMTTWVKGAVQAKLQNYNGIIETLREIGKTGVVTDYQRQKIINGVGGIGLSMAVFGARGARVPGLFTEFTNPTDTQINEVPETLGTFLVNQIADTLKFDNALRYTLRDGAFQKITGRSSARTESVPIVGSGIGNDIAGSMIIGRATNLVDSVIEAVRAGDPSLVLGGILGSAIPTDIDKMVDQQVEGKSYDFQGNELNLPQRGTIIDQIGAVSKNVPPEYERIKDPGYTEVDTSIKKKFSRVSFEDLMKPEQLNNLVDTSIEIYPENPEKAVDLIMSVMEDKLTPEKSKLYKSFGSKANEILAMPKEVLQDYKVIQRLSPEQVAKICAESLEFEQDSQTLMLLTRAGKFDPNDESQVMEVVKAYEKMQQDIIEKLQ